MSKLLVIMNADYSDEFDVKGFSIMSQQQFDKMIEGAKKEIENEGSLEVCFGTNESLLWESADSFKSDFKTKEVTDVDYNNLENVIPGFSFVNGPCNPCGALNEKADYSCKFRLNVKNTPLSYN